MAMTDKLADVTAVMMGNSASGGGRVASAAPKKS
jgi:hypothetical protein